MSTGIWMVMIPLMILAIAAAVGPLLWVMVREARQVAPAVTRDSWTSIHPLALPSETADEVLRAAS